MTTEDKKEESVAINVEKSTTDQSKYTLIKKTFESISGKVNKEALIKWGMRGKLKTFTYLFDKPFHVGTKDDFISDFFRDESVRNGIQRMSKNGEWLSSLQGVNIGKVSVEEVDCSLLSVELFDRLFDGSEESKITRGDGEDGEIKKCFDEYSDDNILVSDELRKMLLIGDSENYDMYSTRERNELLFRLFRHLCVGGACCQFEDTIQPYVDVTKAIYKDLVSVVKDSATKKLKIASFVFKVEVFDEKKKKCYPGTTIVDEDFCYLIIDPFKRHIIVLYHKYDGPLFIE